jgi:acetylornithine deacetylase
MNQGGEMVVTDTAWEQIASEARAESLKVLQRMVGFDTEATTYSDPAREDAAHQEYLAEYLTDLGAKVELFEPEEAVFREHPMTLPGQTFAGRPVLWAELPGGEKPSLLFNGHYDTVATEPVDEWTHGPWSGEIADGKLYGRGAVDMKGGIAAALGSVASLVRAGFELPGPVLFHTVPFEEHNGMGTTATMLQGGFRADAAVCCEPTEMQPVIACHGILGLRLSVEGRNAHAEFLQPHHSDGGGVNAVDKLCLLLEEMRRLGRIWETDPAKQHPVLPAPTALLSLVRGGDFWASYPSSAEATYDITFQTSDADADGYGGNIRAEIEQRLLGAAALDDWLVEHPPKLEWFVDFPSGEIDPSEPVVVQALAAASEVLGRAVEPGGFGSWADQVMLIKEGGIPTVLWGPGSVEQAHTVDEFITVEEMERGVDGYLAFLRRWWS